MQDNTRRKFLRTSIILPVVATIAPTASFADPPPEPSHSHGFNSGPAPGERISVALTNSTSVPITYKVKVTWYVLLAPGYSVVATEERTQVVQPGQQVTMFFYNDHNATHHGVDITTP